MTDAPTTRTKHVKRAAAAASDPPSPPPAATDAPSADAVAESPLLPTEDSYKTELQAAVDALKGELQEHSEERDRVLLASGMTVDQARQLSDAHMDRLHKYNDIKDAGQVLFGKLAELRGKTVKEIHEEYGVKSDD
ncbi:swi5-like zinc finger protein [Coemansia erecta]|uniref:Swi5-like zinc finger protein n=1 Tax=Coemansia erecta TaxID=147472 RepID=A0A9W7Y4W0_9FUNG|nr:swi5-like zinc finger protein [Coemansia erecta]